MQRAVLMDANGARLQSELISCSMLQLLAQVTWQIGSEQKWTYSAVVRFGASGPQEALTPTALHPVILEWPQDVPPHEPRSLRADIPQECSFTAQKAVARELHFPGVGEAECVGESRMTRGDPKWCAPIQPGRAVYRIREWNAFSHQIQHSAHVTFQGDGASVVLGGWQGELFDVQPLLEKLELVWEAPSRVEESCRDGALSVVEGREHDRWKAVLRYCHSIVSFEQVFDLAMPRGNAYSQ